MAKITLADFNSLQARVTAILGVGSGTSGYGQTMASSQLPAGRKVKALEYDLLMQDVTKGIKHQSGTTPSSPSFNVGQKVKYAEFAELTLLVSDLETNKMEYAVASRSVVANAFEVQTPTVWGSGSAKAITTEVSLTWPSYDHARHFFNSGGAITLNMSHNSTASVHDESWQMALASIGTITLSALATSKTGSNGTVVVNGFYNLTSSYQEILNAASAGSSTYASNTVMVYGKVVGSVMTLRFVLSDNYTNPVISYDTVQAETKVSLGYAKAVNPLTGILTPTFGNPTPFESFSSLNEFALDTETNLVLSSNVAWYNSGTSKIIFTNDGSIVYDGAGSGTFAGPTRYVLYTLPSAGSEYEVSFTPTQAQISGTCTVFGIPLSSVPPTGTGWVNLGTDQMITVYQPTNGSDSYLTGELSFRKVGGDAVTYVAPKLVNISIG